VANPTPGIERRRQLLMAAIWKATSYLNRWCRVSHERRSQAGLIFWFKRKTFFGSYFFLIAASRV
jgi:hypothetical protein